MIEFKHSINGSERYMDYLNLTDGAKHRYGSEIAAEGAELTVFDGKGRKFEMKRHGPNQLSRCTAWYKKNAVKMDTAVLVRFDSRETDENGNRVLHLIPQYGELNGAFDSVLFVHAGKQYEIRTAFDGYTMHVRAFLEGKPANGFEYSVDLPVAVDFKLWAGSSVVEPLIESAKHDILDNSWQKIQEFCKTNGE